MSRFRASLEILLVVALWAGLMVFGRSEMFRDPGTFWHTALGERMLDSGQVERFEPFSFTFGGSPFVGTQWLAEWVMAGLYRAGGWDALLMVTTGILAIVFAGLAIGLMRGGLHPMGALLLVAMALAASSHQFHVRPLMATVALVALTFGWLSDVDAGRRPLWHLCWLVPIMALWANLHGGVLAGLGTLVLCAAGWVFETIAFSHRPFQRRWSMALLAAIVAGSVLAVLVNPYGLDLPRAWWKILRLPLGEVLQEHAPLDPTTPYGLVIVVLGAVYVVCLAGALPTQLRVTWLVPVVWYAAGCLAIRHAVLFAVTAMIAMADMLPHTRWVGWLADRGWFKMPSGVGQPRRAPFWPVVPVLLVIGGLLAQWSGSTVPLVGRGWARLDPQRWPVELLPSLRAIESQGSAVPVFNDALFGGYLIFFTPGLRVFIDDRAEVYGPFFLEYDRARQAEPGRIESWRERYGFRHALVEADSELDRYLSRAAGWKPLGRCESAALYEVSQPEASPRKR